jgi:modulator of FtsH protease
MQNSVTSKSKEEDNRYSVLSGAYGLLAVGLAIMAIVTYSMIGVNIGLWPSIGVIVATFILLFIVMYFKNSVIGLFAFFGFCALIGIGFAPSITHVLKMADGMTILVQTLVLTSAITFAMSVYAMVTKRNLSWLGGFLFAGLVIVVVSMVLNLFIHSSILGLVYSIIGAFVFSGYILYDTKNIVDKKITTPIEGALCLFLDIINLFQSLLNILTRTK